MNAAQPFSDRVVTHLRLADHRLRTTDPSMRRRRYAILRMTMSNITTVDSFYIGFYLGDDTVIIPYIYDHDVYMQPDISKYGPGGMSHWIRSSGKTYTWSQDNGALMSRTIPFGNCDERSLDAIVIPLRDPETGEPTGIMSVQSLTANTYDTETIRAAEWLGEALMLSAARDRHIGGKSAVYAAHPELNSAEAIDHGERFSLINHQLEQAAQRSSELIAAAEQVGNESMTRSASTIKSLLENVQTDIAEWMLAQPDESSEGGWANAATSLTSRELEIASLIASDNVTNTEIAQRLHISLKTVKTHVGNILRKLGVSQRSAIVFALADVLAEPPQVKRGS
ncbi:helix-turn-helix transcriptional regulator [Calidifontibacter terrae]